MPHVSASRPNSFSRVLSRRRVPRTAAGSPPVVEVEVLRSEVSAPAASDIPACTRAFARTRPTSAGQRGFPRRAGMSQAAQRVTWCLSLRSARAHRTFALTRITYYASAIYSCCTRSACADVPSHPRGVGALSSPARCRGVVKLDRRQSEARSEEFIKSVGSRSPARMPAASGRAVRLSPERECTDCTRHGDVLHYCDRGDEQ
jgi:hypothetical protein